MLEVTAGLADEVGADFWTLGGEARSVGQARCIRNRHAPLVADCNLVHGPLAGDPARLARDLDEACAWIASPRVRVRAGPGTTAAAEAALVLAGWRPDDTQLDLLLTGDCPRPERPGVAVRHADTDGDWRRLAAMFRLDHEEEDQKSGREPRPEEETEQSVLTRRRKTPHVRYWLAWDGDTPAGFVCSWPRGGEPAMVEDLFVHPAHRGHGIAGALLHHAVTDARSGGAGAVLIRADADDWPKDFYHRRGFQPVAVSRYYGRPAGHEGGSARAR